MNKSELIDAMAADAGISKAAAKAALESLIGSVGKTLKGGGRVSLVGFGSWSVSRRAARDGRNPQTGATIKIAAKNVEISDDFTPHSPWRGKGRQRQRARKSQHSAPEEGSGSTVSKFTETVSEDASSELEKSKDTPPTEARVTKSKASAQELDANNPKSTPAPQVSAPAQTLHSDKSVVSNAVPLAEQWKLAFTGDGKVYYYNRPTRASQWDPPVDAVVVNMDQHPDHRKNSSVHTSVHSDSAPVKMTPSRRLEFDLDTASRTLPSGAKLVSDKNALRVSNSANQMSKTISASDFVVHTRTGNSQSMDGRKEGDSTQSEDKTEGKSGVLEDEDYNEEHEKSEESDGVKAALISLLHASPEATVTLFCPFCGDRTPRGNYVNHLDSCPVLRNRDKSGSTSVVHKENKTQGKRREWNTPDNILTPSASFADDANYRTPGRVDHEILDLSIDAKPTQLFPCSHCGRGGRSRSENG